MVFGSRTQSLVLTGLSIALIAAGAFVTVPFGPIPFTLQTLSLGIVICLLPSTYSIAAVAGYLALGCLGMPVFSGMRGGIGVLAGPTGGFLIGFLFAAVLIALVRNHLLASEHGSVVAEPKSRPLWFLPAVDALSLLILTLVYNTLGTLWFMVSTGASLSAALVACIVPFIVPDIFKAVAAFICVQPVRAALGYGRMATR